ncbi:MAG TPA: ATP-binding protein [Thermoanaerobaculia bacterium]|jgi:signal transduction histidine kinase
MSNRVSGPIEQLAWITVLLVTLVGVTGTLAVVACIDIVTSRRELAEAAADGAARVERALRAGDTEHALEGIGAIAAARLYAADGSLIAQTPPPPPLRPALSTRLAARFAAAEIVCSRNPAGETFCTEPAAAPLAIRVSWWFRVLGAGALAALLLGAAAGALVRRALLRRIVPLADSVSRLARDHDFSHRIPAAAGSLGTLGGSINTLVEQMQERDTSLRRRSLELEASNKDLEGFAYAVVHDLRGPLGSIDGFAQALEEDHKENLDDLGKECVDWIRRGCHQMRELIEGLMEMGRVTRAELVHDEVDLSSIARSVAETLKQKAPDRQVRFEIREGARTVGDARLLRAVLENLMNNAFKFTRNRDEARIEFGVVRNGGDPTFYVRDNGAGFDQSHAAKMFRPFQRLHSTRDFEGTGIGLATVQKIVMRHGGKAWAEGEVGKGATIYFTTGSESPAAREMVHA